MATAVPRILIAGGGAGGLELAIRLARATGRGKRAEVTLADPAPAHLWKPRLHEVAVGLLIAADERARFAEQAAMHGFTFVLGGVEAIDATSRTARIAAVRDPDNSQDLIPQRKIGFDLAVLAIGSTIADFGVPGVLEHCHVLDTPDGAERLNAELLAQAARIAAGAQPRLRVAIVGAGTTGVELAADLRSAAHRLPLYRSLLNPDQVEVILLEMADRPLPGVATDSSDYARALLNAHGVETRFGAKVTKVEAGQLWLEDGEEIAADILVWASGVQGRKIDMTPRPKLEANRRIRVDDRLRVITEDGQVIALVFAIGDCAAFFGPGEDKPVGATAQAAHQQAHLLARSLSRCVRGGPLLPFHYHYRGTLVSLGGGKAVGDLPAAGWSFRITGITAKIAYRLLYQSHLLQLFGWVGTAALAIAAALRRSAAPSVKLHW